MKKIWVFFLLAVFVLGISVTGEAYYNWMWDGLYESAELDYELEEGMIGYEFRPLLIDDGYAIDSFSDLENSFSLRYGIREEMELRSEIGGVDYQHVEVKYDFYEQDQLAVALVPRVEFDLSEAVLDPGMAAIIDYDINDEMSLYNYVYVKITDRLEQVIDNTLDYDFGPGRGVRLHSHMWFGDGLSRGNHLLRAAYRQEVTPTVTYIGFLETENLVHESGFINYINNVVAYDPEDTSWEISSWYTLNPGADDSIYFGFNNDFEEIDFLSRFRYNFDHNYSELRLAVEYEF